MRSFVEWVAVVLLGVGGAYFAHRAGLGTTIYDLLGVTLATVLGFVVFFAVVKASRRDEAFLDKEYLKWLGYVVAFAVVSPILYKWASPVSLSLPEAIFLEVRAAGWTYALMAYSSLAGVLVGGAVAIALKLGGGK